MDAARSDLSPRELAEAIGVSESSVKRWADDGKVRVARTAGGHRRIPLAEAIRFVRSSRLRLVKPEVLGLAEIAAASGAPPDSSDEEGQLFAFLRFGEGVHVRGFLQSRYMEGSSVAQIVDGPLRAALARLGELWHHGQRGIFFEHRAADLVIRALSQLRGLLPDPAPGAPAAVGGAPEGDPYLIPSLAVATVLQDLGVAATNLGPQTPTAVLADAAAALDAKIVWLSLSSPPGRRDLEAEVRALLSALEPVDATLVVGGRSRDAVDFPHHPRLVVGASMGELAAFARGLAQTVTA